MCFFPCSNVRVTTSSVQVQQVLEAERVRGHPQTQLKSCPFRDSNSLWWILSLGILLRVTVARYGSCPGPSNFLFFLVVAFE